MWNEEIRDLALSECERDYKKNHFWERIGVQDNCIVYCCSQCQKCIKEPIFWLVKHDDSKNVRAEAKNEL